MALSMRSNIKPRTCSCAYHGLHLTGVSVLSPYSDSGSCSQAQEDKSCVLCDDIHLSNQKQTVLWVWMSNSFQGSEDIL